MVPFKFVLFLVPAVIASRIVQRDAAQALADLQQTSGALTAATNALNAWKPNSGAYGALLALGNVNQIASDWNKSAADAASVPKGNCQDVTNLYNYISSNLSTVSRTFVNTISARRADFNTYNFVPQAFAEAKNLREQVIKIFDTLIPKACTSGPGQDLKDSVESIYTFFIYSFGPTTDGPPTSIEDLNFLIGDGATFLANVNNLTVNGDGLYRIFSFFKHYQNDLNQTSTDYRLYYASGCPQSKDLANKLTTTVAPGIKNLLAAINSKKAAITTLGTFYRNRIEGYLKDMKTLTDTLGAVLLSNVCSSYRASVTSTFNAIDSYYNTAINTYAA